ncbi:flagellar biosynthetic protein FliO [Salimicrobium halophilum]|uniref:Flagellar protein FliO/FliZ n=1 Tax=Salimicrobium halophilum TaxID=86666 RepID=A0A1G8QA34_9BACI|nr:flagellar biosynthetic protein FliO [Salimicrobium halophilum]SDJ01632.1 flagellar protein FliO/FliZ [Salimicrobium halophilum]
MKYLKMILCLMTALTFLSPTSVHATGGPSVSECAENPDLEGCGASTDQEDTEASGDSSEPLWWSATKLVLALAFVLLLIYGILKFVQRKNKLFSRTRKMENLGGIPLGQNRSVQAVKVGDKVYLLGVGDTVEMLTEVTDEQTKNQLVQEDNEGNLTNFSLTKKQEKEGESTVQFQQLFSKHLSDMKHTKEKSRRKGDQSDE